MKRIFLVFIIVSVLVASTLIGWADESKENGSVGSHEENISIKEEFDDTFSLKKETIILDGVQTNLFREFTSQENALMQVKKRCSILLNKIMNSHDLEVLTESNWQDYYTKMKAIFDDEKTKNLVKESDYEYRYLRAFFDIYENKYKNDKVKALASLDKKKVIMDDGAKKTVEEVLAENLPYDETISREFYDGVRGEIESQASSPKSVPNVSRAVYYANKYAYSPNHYQYYVFSFGDCTNFISQILEYSGVGQIVYNSVYSGWWHKYYSSSAHHEHSRSWTMADTFARYMGVTLTRTNHRAFSEKVYKGCIIGADFYNDGDWDHLGFVTAKDNYAATYNGWYYYDYKVAQHTSNYHRWVSNSDNNWEYIGSDGGKYARIRG